MLSDVVFYKYILRYLSRVRKPYYNVATLRCIDYREAGKQLEYIELRYV